MFETCADSLTHPYIGALPNPDRPQSPRIIRDPDEYFGIPLGGGSERRSGGGSRRSARRDEGSQGDGEWIGKFDVSVL